MSRLVSVVLAAASVVVAGLLLLSGLPQTTTHYSLPSPAGVTRHTSVFGPGVAAVVLCAIVVLFSALWLVLAAIGRSARWMLVAIVGLLVLDVVVLIAVSVMARPSF